MRGAVKEGQVYTHAKTGETCEVVDILDGIVQVLIYGEKGQRDRDVLINIELFLRWWNLKLER